MNSNHKESHHKIMKIIMMIIIIIIIILLLITSCSCTANFWGRIGNLFTQEENVDIDDDTNNPEIILDKDLKFDTEKLEMHLSDENGKITFTYQNISPKEFTCTTSNAEIATCFVKDDYVVINPKKAGTVDVVLETKTNGKIYRAKASVNIQEATRYLQLSSKGGTINLSTNPTKLLSYTLVGLSGEVKVTISDNSIASVSVKNGIVTITGKKVGSAIITVSVVFDNRVYSATYQLTVTNQTVTNPTPSPTQEPQNPNEGEDQPNPPVVKDSDSSLKLLTPSKGNITLQSGVYHYYLAVDSTVSELTLEAVPNSKKAIVTYLYQGNPVDSLEHLKLNEGENKVTIIVTAEDGTVSVYEVTIDRTKYLPSRDNILDELKVSEGTLTPEFNPDILNYQVTVDSSVSSLDVNAKVHDSKSTVTYRYNGKEVDNLEDLELLPGDNKVEVTVTSESGKSKTYTVTIHKKVRTIDIEKEEYNISVDGKTYTILYNIYEDGIELAIGPYDIQEIQFDFPGYVGEFTIQDGYITLKPEESMISRLLTLTLTYSDSKDSTKIKFTIDDYYLSTPSNHLDMSVTGEHLNRNLVLKNNFFQGDVVWEEVEEGKIKIYDPNNPEIYIEITYDPTSLSVSSIKGRDSLALELQAKKEGTYHLQVKGFIYGKEIEDMDITLDITRKYLLTLDANGGQFNEFTTEYQFQLEKDEIFNLAPYLTGYLVKEDCSYYSLEGFYKEYLSNQEGKGTAYTDSITVDSDITLYAVYSKTPEEETPPEEKTLYLTDVDLFHNEEYFEKYGEDKVIYPGATGSYIMTINNTSSEEINIKYLTLKEDTICIDNKGCLNMGYVIKDYTGTYHYGTSDDGYLVLENHTEENQIDTPTTLQPGESTEISILWKWIETNDELDTMIGNLADENLEDTLYSLTIGIHFETKNTTCDPNGVRP